MTKLKLSRNFHQDFIQFPLEQEHMNGILHSLLQANLLFHSDCEIPFHLVTDIMPLVCLKSETRCFGKVISNSSLVLAFLPTDTFTIEFIEYSKQDITADDSGNQKQEVPEKPSYAKKLYYDSLKETHSKNFSKVVYTSLRERNEVDPQIVKAALDSFSEFDLSVIILFFFFMLKTRLNRFT